LHWIQKNKNNKTYQTQMKSATSPKNVMQKKNKIRFSVVVALVRRQEYLVSLGRGE